MKKLIRRIFIICSLFFLAGSAFAQTTYDWTGAAGTSWATPGNWNIAGVAATTYPGQIGSTDIVNIGVTTATNTTPFTNQPTLTSGTINIASLTFGNNNAPVGTSTMDPTTFVTTNMTTPGVNTLTINGIINVGVGIGGTVLQLHSVTGGGANSATTTYKKADGTVGYTGGTTTTSIITTILGTGALNCDYLKVGDATTVPGNPFVNNVTQFIIGSNSSVASPITIKVSHDFTQNSVGTSMDDPTGMPNVPQVVLTRNSDTQIYLYQGTLTVSGNYAMVNNNATPTFPFALFEAAYKPTNKFNIVPLTSTGGGDANFNYGGASIAFGNPSSSDYANTIDFIDFFDVSVNGGVSGSRFSRVSYTGTGNQEVYTNNNPLHVDIGGYVYNVLSLSGGGTKTTDGGTLTVSSTMTVGSATTSATLDMVASNTILALGSSYTTFVGSLVKTGTGTATLSGGTFNNSGTSTFGTGLVTFNGGGNLNIAGATGITNFTNVLFKNGGPLAGAPSTSPNGTVTMTSGAVNLVSTGVMTLSKNSSGGFVTLNVITPQKFTLLSDANGSATIAALLNGCNITGSVDVQRYIPGGSAAARGYRLLSSPVYTATNGLNKIYSINYLLNSTYISGTNFATTATSKAGNPSLYLYRENLLPAFTSFLNSNFRGIATISASPSYTIDVDGGPFNIPVGNGYLFYFRGGLGTTNPFVSGSVPNAGTLTATGTLNQGAVIVSQWYNSGFQTLKYTTTSGDPSIEGLSLVGNPYPAAIDWNNFSSTNGSAGIYGPNVGPFVYQLHPGGQAGSGNYGVWSQANGSTNGGTSIIASGEGFFVYALPPPAGTASLTFTEGAKVNTSPGPTIYMAKLPASARVAIAAPQFLRFKLALDTVNTDEMLIHFAANAKTTFDPTEDAPYRAGTGKVNLASFSNDNRALAINSLPLPVKGQTIPLRVGATANGTYSLSANEITGIPQIYDIWLKDAYAKDSVNMRKTASYSFTIALSDTGSFGAHRFSIVLNQDTALAYKLISFTADKVDKKQQTDVVWKAANEQSYTNFTVERSTDNGKTYDVIGSVPSSGQGTYSFLDREPITGENLYRLKQEDFNNSITLSNVVGIQFSNLRNDNVRLRVYPNPAVNNILVSIDPKSQAAGTYKIRVTNSLGTVVRQVVTKQNSWEDNVSQLFTGTYLIQVVNDKDNTLVGQTKFVKL